MINVLQKQLRSKSPSIIAVQSLRQSPYTTKRESSNSPKPGNLGQKRKSDASQTELRQKDQMIARLISDFSSCKEKLHQEILLHHSNLKTAKK